jgi:cell division protein FtsI (penicillin-binding protein 3)
VDTTFGTDAVLAPLSDASLDAESRSRFSARHIKRGVLGHARELFRLRHDKSTSLVFSLVTAR